MNGTHDPRWLTWLERRMGWLAIPNIAILLVTLQALGFFMLSSNPGFFRILALVPGDVIYHHEYWRLITYLALPMTPNPLWLLFGLLFLYSILNSIENSWGAFKTTLYVLVSVVVTSTASLALNVPVVSASDFISTLFLAAATLFPEMSVLLFFVVPVKLKWLAFLSGAYVLYQMIDADWPSRILTLALYSNYLLFFGPAALDQIRNRIRRARFRSKL